MEWTWTDSSWSCFTYFACEENIYFINIFLKRIWRKLRMVEIAWVLSNTAFDIFLIGHMPKPCLDVNAKALSCFGIYLFFVEKQVLWVLSSRALMYSKAACKWFFCDLSASFTFYCTTHAKWLARKWWNCVTFCTFTTVFSLFKLR